MVENRAFFNSLSGGAIAPPLFLDIKVRATKNKKVHAPGRPAARGAGPNPNVRFSLADKKPPEHDENLSPQLLTNRIPQFEK